MRQVMGVFAFLLLSLPAFVHAADEPAAVPSASPPAWEKQFVEDGVTVYSRQMPGSPVVALRGECDMDATLAKLATIMGDTPRKTEWMHQLVESRMIHKISENERVEYNHTAVPWPFQDREFVYHAKMDFDPAHQRMVLKVESVDDDAEHYKKNITRGWLTDTIYTFQKIDATRTHVDVQVNADPRGEIPTWMVNLFQKKWPLNTLNGIRRQAAKPDVVENEGIRALFGTQPGK